ncbi:MAG: ATP synthase F1 subunit delta [Oscillospiraceae bacterium]|nr:ATP synthase F1 subunit delta [Oscillospiraceae bacterium]
MNDKAEKVYGEAFFELVLEENASGAENILAELKTLAEIFSQNPGLTKLMGTPTIPVKEKVALVKDIASTGGVSELTENLLCVLAERGRFDCFGGIVKNFSEMYNEHFGIAEITVTTPFPLSEKMRQSVIDKMTETTGKKVTLKEKLDPALVGGIVIDYGTTRYDGSVRTRLNALRSELGSVIS